MSMQKGTLVELKMSDGASPTETFTAIGGLRTIDLHVQRAIQTANTVNSGAWRHLVEESGVSAVRVQGNGSSLNDAVEQRLRNRALDGKSNCFELYFANGDILRGDFMVAHYASSGNVRDAESFALTLESAGTLSFTPAS